jgi:hypothetical protein
MIYSIIFILKKQQKLYYSLRRREQIQPKRYKILKLETPGAQNNKQNKMLDTKLTPAPETDRKQRAARAPQLTKEQTVA